MSGRILQNQQIQYWFHQEAMLEYCGNISIFIQNAQRYGVVGPQQGNDYVQFSRQK